MSDTIGTTGGTVGGTSPLETNQPIGSGGAGGASGQEGVGELISRLTRQGAHLAQEQVHLMQAEVREAAHDVQQAVGAYAGAAVLGISGLGVTLMGLGYLLGDAIENLGLGILIVGVITLVIAAILYGSGKKKASAAQLKPDRTLRTIQDTPEAATGNLTNTGGTHGR